MIFNKNDNNKNVMLKNKKHRTDKPMKKILALTLGSVVMLSGCNGNLNDLQDYVSQQKTKPATPIDPIPEVKPYLRYEYPGHEKDPFDFAMLAPSAAPVIDSGIKVDTSRVPEFLEGYPLDSLRMVGTVNKDKTLWALVKIPDGAVQSVKAGNFMGQNFGKVVSIDESKMELKEIVSNGLGGYKERETTVVLNQ